MNRVPALVTAALVTAALVTAAPAAMAQPAPTVIRRNTDHVTDPGAFHDAQDSGVRPIDPSAGPVNVGTTGSVAGERDVNTALRGSATPMPDQVDMTTPIGPGDVARLMRAQEPRLRPCYDRALPTHPALAGRMELRFTIGRTGTLTQTAATGLTEAPEVATCITEALRTIRFPPPSTGTLPFMYPMMFAPPAPLHPGRGHAAHPPAAHPAPAVHH